MSRAITILTFALALVFASRARADELAEQPPAEVTAAEATTADVTTTEATTAEAPTAGVEATASVDANLAVTSADMSVDANPAPTAESRAVPIDEEDARIAAGLAERRRLRPWHILFGNLTWAASNIATIFGFIQFHDRYGFDGNPASAGCVRGNAIFGDTCPSGSVPIPHVVAITALTLFYGSAFTVSLLMPDPLGVGEGPSAHSQEINVHRALRWTSLAIMALQIVLGAISQNVEFNDFGADRAMAATHVALGTVSWGVLTAQGIVGSLLAY